MTELLVQAAAERSDEECWPWPGQLDQDKYPRYGASQGRWRSIKVTRWLLDAPAGLIVRHTCDNPPCVNPGHLTLGTWADNMQDRDRRGRTARGGHHGNAKLTDAQAADIRASTEKGVDLARRYGVGVQAIYRLRRGQTYNNNPKGIH